MSISDAFFAKSGLQKNSQLINPVGTNPFAILPFIKKGWEFRMDAYGRMVSGVVPNAISTDTITIKKTGGGWRMPLKDKEKPSWLEFVIAAFDNPLARLELQVDQVDFQLSPALLTSLALAPGNYLLKFGGATAMSYYGPIYMVVYDPASPLPLTTELRLEANLDPNGIVDTAEVLAMVAGRVVVTDYEDFYDEVQRFSTEMASGKELKKWRSVK